MSTILVLYYSRSGHCEKMAHLVCRGIESIADMNAQLRTVPPLKTYNDPTHEPIPTSGAPYATLEDLAHADGLCLGCPTHFGNMPAPMKAFWDNTTSLWKSGALIDKVAGVFTSTGSLHGGQETTLITMMLPLLHHGMIMVGLPYSEHTLLSTRSGGTPYGATHVAGSQGDLDLTEDEKTLCIALGTRIALKTQQLQSSKLD
ncbi:MAG: NAD(P)H-quinone oxidoreductase [Legionellales bacterium]|nr:NAD(P)H-quinone oxidoreductase [Legionellales bacterium]